MRAKYGQGWKRSGSEQLNREFWAQFGDLSQKHAQAQQVDFEIMENYKASTKFLELAYQPDEQIVKQLPQKQVSQEFITQYQQVFESLVGTDIAIQNKVEEMRKILYAIAE